ncbi:hypothetical protein L226DRAFT_347799 [Lentinus tigrinus ALCF2SS1-7]|nr:hypothetical protein L226DRAFT_347799 [Lentinus tigrinus ALCF2SS1-7]
MALEGHQNVSGASGRAERGPRQLPRDDPRIAGASVKISTQSAEPLDNPRVIANRVANLQELWNSAQRSQAGGTARIPARSTASLSPGTSTPNSASGGAQVLPVSTGQSLRGTRPSVQLGAMLETERAERRQQQVQRATVQVSGDNVRFPGRGLTHQVIVSGLQRPPKTSQIDEAEDSPEAGPSR